MRLLQAGNTRKTLEYVAFTTQLFVKAARQWEAALPNTCWGRYQFAFADSVCKLVAARVAVFVTLAIFSDDLQQAIQKLWMFGSVCVKNSYETCIKIRTLSFDGTSKEPTLIGLKTGFDFFGRNFVSKCDC